MASRGGPGVGVYVTITILAVLSLTLFILTFVFLSKYQAAQTNLAARDADLREFVTRDERLSDGAREVVEMAKRSNKSAFAYMRDSLQTVMSKVSGVGRDTVEGLDQKLATIEGAGTTNLIAVIRDRQAQIDQLNGRLKAAEDARQRALADLESQVEKQRAVEQSTNATVAELTSAIGAYKSEVDVMRDETNAFRTSMDERVQKIIDDAEAEKAALRTQLNKLSTEVSSLNEQLKIARGQSSDSMLAARPEEALVDGRVVALNPAAGQVSINLGRRDHVQLGMRFAVYSSAAVIQPDEAGNYPPGKASLEVVSVGESDSACRIVPGSEIRGNPVIRGDVIANAVYDPRKVYKFVVSGSFDANGDGLSTPSEADEVKAVIQEWGGRIIDDLAGDVDFLILGERPVVPPPPRPQDPMDIVRQWQLINADAQKYDALLSQARGTSIPILNQNRLNTLIGRPRGADLR